MSESTNTLGPIVFNLFADDGDERRSNPGYAWQRTGVGRRASAANCWAQACYQLAPGQRSWPDRAHYANEELLIVLDGRPTL